MEEMEKSLNLDLASALGDESKQYLFNYYFINIHRHIYLLQLAAVAVALHYCRFVYLCLSLSVICLHYHNSYWNGCLPWITSFWSISYLIFLNQFNIISRYNKLSMVSNGQLEFSIYSRNVVRYIPQHYFTAIFFPLITEIGIDPVVLESLQL